jgi:hypothetical protein
VWSAADGGGMRRGRTRRRADIREAAAHGRVEKLTGARGSSSVREEAEGRYKQETCNSIEAVILLQHR